MRTTTQIPTPHNQTSSYARAVQPTQAHIPTHSQTAPSETPDIHQTLHSIQTLANQFNLLAEQLQKAFAPFTTLVLQKLP